MNAAPVKRWRRRLAKFFLACLGWCLLVYGGSLLAWKVFDDADFGTALYILTFYPTIVVIWFGTLSGILWLGIPALARLKRYLKQIAGEQRQAMAVQKARKAHRAKKMRQRAG